VHADTWPHRTLLLDLPVSDGIGRARSRGAAADRFETEEQAFFERVRAGYLQIAAAEPQRVQVLDALAAAPTVAQRALAALADLLPPAAAGHR